MTKKRHANSFCMQEIETTASTVWYTRRPEGTKEKQKKKKEIIIIIIIITTSAGKREKAEVSLLP